MPTAPSFRWCCGKARAIARWTMPPRACSTMPVCRPCLSARPIPQLPSISPFTTFCCVERAQAWPVRSAHVNAHFLNADPRFGAGEKPDSRRVDAEADHLVDNGAGGRARLVRRLDLLIGVAFCRGHGHHVVLRLGPARFGHFQGPLKLRAVGSLAAVKADIHERDARVRLQSLG